MKKSTVLSTSPIQLVFLLLIFCSAALHGQTSAQQIRSKIDGYFTALMAIGKFNGVIYVKVGGKDIIKKAYNLSGDPKSPLRVSTSSQFDIHSVSKLIAVAAIAELEAAGKLSQTDTIGKFIPQLPFSSRITIGQLIAHRSGLARELSATIPDKLSLSSDEIVGEIAKMPMEFEPGSQVRYSNLGYELLYEIIHRVTGRPFARYLSEGIFQRLNMDSTGAHFFSGKRGQLKSYVQNHRDIEGKPVRVDNIQKSEFATARIYSDADDLMDYLTEMNARPYRSTLESTKGVIEKNGGSDGIRAQIYANNKFGYSFVMLSNYDGIPFSRPSPT